MGTRFGRLILNSIQGEIMSPATKELKAFKERVDKMHTLLIEQCLRTHNEQKNSQNLQDLVDTGFLFREMENRLDEMRKEAKAKHLFYSSKISMARSKMIVEDPTLSDKIQGELATGTVDCTSQATLPHPVKSPEEYQSTMEYFKVRKEVIEGQILKLDFKKFAEVITEFAEAGRKVPFKVGKIYQVWKTTFRRKS